MRVNSNMLMGLVLCMVLFGGVAFLTRINKGQHVWTPNDIYSTIGGSSYSIANVSTSTASNSGVTLSLRSSRPLLSSARRSTSSVISYAPAQFLPVANTQYPTGGTPSYSSKGTSALYTTSGATVKSFGGGGDFASVSISGGVVSANSSSSPNSLGTLSPNIPSPMAYYPQPTKSFAGSQFPVMSSQLQAIGANSVDYGVSNPLGIRGRRDAAPGMTNQYYGWLTSWWGDDESGKGWDHSEGGIITIEELEALFYSMTGETSFSNPQAWESFYNWFMDQINANGKVSYNGYNWELPLSDAIPFLLLLCMFYVWGVYRKTKKHV